MFNIENKNKLKLVCNEFISVNHYMNYRVQGKIVMAYKPVKTKNFEKNFGKYIKEEIKKQNWIKPTKDKFIVMDTVFYFHRTDMDAQNYFKSMCDIMTTSEVWDDDNKVIEKVHRIYYDKKNPRIEIGIYESDFIGIFDKVCEYEAFKDKCATCKRYKNGVCGIHKKALESRIQDEVIKKNEIWTCLKYNKLKK